MSSAGSTSAFDSEKNFTICDGFIQVGSVNLCKMYLFAADAYSITSVPVSISIIRVTCLVFLIYHHYRT